MNWQRIIGVLAIVGALYCAFNFVRGVAMNTATARVVATEKEAPALAEPQSQLRVSFLVDGQSVERDILYKPRKGLALPAVSVGDTVDVAFTGNGRDAMLEAYRVHDRFGMLVGMFAFAAIAWGGLTQRFRNPFAR
jgi:hypothetical protein